MATHLTSRGGPAQPVTIELMPEIGLKKIELFFDPHVQPRSSSLGVMYTSPYAAADGNYCEPARSFFAAGSEGDAGSRSSCESVSSPRSSPASESSSDESSSDDDDESSEPSAS